VASESLQLVWDKMMDKDDIHAEVKRLKRERARQRRLEREKLQEIVLFRSKLIQVRETALKEDPKEDVSAVDDVITIVDALIAIRRLRLLRSVMNDIDTLQDKSWPESVSEQALRNAVRKAKIEMKRRVAVDNNPAQEDTNLRSRCHKRPRHFDEYCKRCANELGIRPTGKIT
jgi:hypothetical protein